MRRARPAATDTSPAPDSVVADVLAVIAEHCEPARRGDDEGPIARRARVVVVAHEAGPPWRVGNRGSRKLEAAAAYPPPIIFIMSLTFVFMPPGISMSPGSRPSLHSAPTQRASCLETLVPAIAARSPLASVVVTTV